MTTREQAETRMRALLNAQPARKLADALALMELRPRLGDAERFARSVLISVLCERCPEADAAFAAWAESDDCDIRNASAVMIAAARTEGRA